MIRIKLSIIVMFLWVGFLCCPQLGYCQAQKLTFPRLGNSLLAVNFNKKGDAQYALASLGMRGQVLWDLKDPKVSPRFFETKDLAQVAVFTPDGHYVAIGFDRNIQVWDTKTATLYKKFDVGRMLNIKTMVFSADGKKLVVSSDRKLLAVNIFTSTSAQILSGHTNNIQQVVFIGRGNKFASRDEGKLIIWGDKYEKLRTIDEKYIQISAVLNSDKLLLLDSTGQITRLSVDQNIALATAERVGKLTDVPTDDKIALQFAPNLQDAVVSSNKNSIKQIKISANNPEINLSTAKILTGAEVNKDNDCQINFSADGEHITRWCTKTDRISKWAVVGNNLVKTWEGSEQPVLTAAWAANGQVISVTRQKIWNWSGNGLSSAKFGMGTPPAVISSARISLNATYIAVSTDNEFYICNINNKSCVEVVDQNGLKMPIAWVNSDQRVLVSANSNSGSELGILNITNNKWETVTRKEATPNNELVFAGVDTLNNWLFTNYLDETMYKLPLNIGLVQLPYNVFPPHQSSKIYALAGIAGNLLISAQGHDLQLWDTKKAQLIKTFTFQNATSVALSHDAEYVASGDSVGLIKIWNAKSEQSAITAIGHTGKITALQFSADNSQLLSASKDGTVCMWDVKTGQLKRRLLHESK